MLTKEQTLSGLGHRRKWVPLPDWTPPGETYDAQQHGVYVGTMTVAERDAWEEVAFSRKASAGGASVRALTAIFTAQDEQGNRLYTMADLPSLSAQASAPLSAIFDAAVEINRVTKQDEEELLKN